MIEIERERASGGEGGGEKVKMTEIHVKRVRNRQTDRHREGGREEIVVTQKQKEQGREWVNEKKGAWTVQDL